MFSGSPRVHLIRIRQKGEEMRVLVLVLQDTEFRPTNNFFIPNSLHQLGIDVTLGDPNSLQIVNGVITTNTCEFMEGNVGSPHPEMNKPASCENFDLVWFLDYPHPNRLVDYFRILWVLNRRVPFVNDPASVFLLNNKIGPLGLESARFFASSSVLSDPQWIQDIREASPDQSFVLKPPDKGCGADVFTLTPGDPNANALIQSSLGNPAQLEEMFGSAVIGQSGNFVVLQEFLPRLRESENRVLLAGGQIVGGYRKISAEGDFRGNYLVGASTAPLDISSSAELISVSVATELLSYGIHFVGIDVSGDHLIEVNLVNPGGISGHLEANGVDIGVDVCQAVLTSCLGTQW
ncbi:Glutathione synthetase [Mobiluncus mulieris]|nr:Glutathione synthetase [Mobiluncus mulieris]